MKKIIAMLLALTTAASLAVTAFADTTDITPTVPETPVTGASVIFEKDANGIELGAQTVLTPGKTYYFPIKYVAAGKTLSEAEALTSAQFNSFRFRFANEDGKRAIDTVKVEKYKSLYSLSIKVKAGWPTTLTDVSYSTTILDTKNNNADVLAPTFNFQAGYKAIDEGTLKNHEYVSVTPSAPVITKDNFDTLNDMSEGKEVTFANDDWEYSVRVNGMKDINMVSNSNEIDEITEKYENNDFKFVSFPAGPEFRSTGTLSIDVSSEMDSFEGKFHVYRYLNGKLIKMDATLNVEDEVLSLKTKQLGRFVVTNKAITGTTVVDNNGSASNGGTSGGNSSNNGNGTETNPDTGAVDFVGIALAMALVSAAGIAVARKRK